MADNALGYRYTSGPIVVNGKIVAGMTGCERYKDGTCFISAHDPQTGAGGPVLEQWWHEQFGHTFDCLTHSEARCLARSPDVDTVRDRIAAAKQEGDGPGCS